MIYVYKEYEVKIKVIHEQCNEVLIGVWHETCYLGGKEPLVGESTEEIFLMGK